MRPEHELDTWLDTLNSDKRAAPPELARQLDAASRVAQLAALAPAPDFTERIEVRFLEGAQRLPAADASRVRGPLHLPRRLPGRFSAIPAGVGRIWPGRWPGRSPRLLLPAAVLLIVCLGSLATLAVAANASPGSSLYSLHRWEQSFRANLTNNPADRTRLHLQYARSALQALNAVVTHRGSDQAYDEALASFDTEQRAAVQSVNELSADASYTTLAAQLLDLRAQARHDLRAALRSLGWPARVRTTAVLASLGDTVPSVAHVTIAFVGLGDSEVWQCTVAGSGFQPGALLVVNGQPVGTVAALTPTTLVATIPADNVDWPPSATTSIGVSNPDGTAAQTTSITVQSSPDENAGATPSPTSEDTPDTTATPDTSGSGDGGSN